MHDPGRRTAERRGESVLSWYRRDAQGWQLSIHAQPGAKKTEVAGLHGEALKIRIAAPPVEGRANEALVRFIASKLGVRVAEVEVMRGESARTKTVRVASAAADPALLLEG